jgi:nicotinate phosphoribosyltransferase
MFDYKHFTLTEYADICPLLSKKMDHGKICGTLPSLKQIQDSVKENLSKLDYTFRRIINPHIYKVSLSQKLKTLKFRMIDELT